MNHNLKNKYCFLFVIGILLKIKFCKKDFILAYLIWLFFTTHEGEVVFKCLWARFSAALGISSEELKILNQITITGLDDPFFVTFVY